MEQMKLASEKGLPPMRPVFFDFPDDPQAAEVEDEFLFGPDMLVAPILEYQARAREVYLPAGADWTNAWTGESAPGGARLVVDAPIEYIPVFIRSGRPALLSLFKGRTKPGVGAGARRGRPASGRTATCVTQTCPCLRRLPRAPFRMTMPQAQPGGHA